MRGALPPPTGKTLRILCVGAHPDDPETGCGGTLARYAEAGHDVSVLYMTKGESEMDGKTPTEVGAMRAAEAEAACRVLGVKPFFFGKQGGLIAVDPATTREMIERLDKFAPDVLFGHWPMDVNYDHQVSGMLTIHAFLAKPRRYPLYMFEVETGTQSLGFAPEVYVEIGPVLQKKIEAIRAHKSQNAERRLYEQHHEPMERFRARAIGGTAAEAFALLAPEAVMVGLPGL